MTINEIFGPTIKALLPLLLVCSTFLFLIWLGWVVFERYRTAKLKELASDTSIVGKAAHSLSTEKMRITKAAREKGIKGELGIAEELELLADKYGLTVLHDLSVPNSKANIDHVVISKRVVFVIDAKNYAGIVRVRKNANGDQILRVGKHDQTKLAMKLKQYVDAMSSSLLKQGIEIRVVGILAFYNAKFHEDSDYHVSGVTVNVSGIENELKRFILREKNDFDTNEVEKIVLKEFPFKS